MSVGFIFCINANIIQGRVLLVSRFAQRVATDINSLWERSMVVKWR